VSLADPEKPADAKVEMKLVKYNQLVETIKAYRGKVVVVEVWGNY
jgi:hypothetical protein